MFYEVLHSRSWSVNEMKLSSAHSFVSINSDMQKAESITLDFFINFILNKDVPKFVEFDWNW